MERLQEKMRSAEKVCVGEKKKIPTWGPAASLQRRTLEKKNLKPEGGAAGPFFLSGEKELGFRVFCIFFSMCQN